MTTSRRARTCALPAAALAAALVLTPAAAFAADGEAAPGASGAQTAATVSPSAADGDPIAIAPADAGAEAGSGTEVDDGATTAEPAAADDAATDDASTDDASSGDVPTDDTSTGADAAVPTQAALPEPTAGDTGDEAVADEPAVFSMDGGDLHPGFAQFFGTEGFTPGDLVGVRVTGSDGQDLSEWAQPADGLSFAVRGDAYFTVLVPVGVAVPDVVTLTVSDESGTEASLEVLVEDFVAAPHLEPPVSATAGVVSVQGQNGEPGQVALVSVVDSSLFDGAEPGGDEGAEGGGDEEADGADLVAVAEDEVVADGPGYVTDDAPVAFDPEEGVAFALVPIDEDGDFTASFVLPAGDYVSDAAVLRRDGTAVSDFSVPVRFSVAAAVVPVVVAPVAVVPAAVTPVAALPSRAARPAGLAYTGSDPSGWLALAAGLVAAGGLTVAASRLRGRRS